MREGQALKQGFRLSALLYDLHTLRADRYVAPSATAETCGSGCRRVIARGAGEVLLDLRLWPSEDGWRGQVDRGPIYALSAERIAHWPFTGLD